MQLPWPTIDLPAALAEFAALPADEQRPYNAMFEEARTIGKPRHKRAIACCLFFRDVDGQPWPKATPATIRSQMSRRGRMTWTAAYLDPLLCNLRRLPVEWPGWDAHVYLAADLHWLASELAMPQVVVHVMHHSSIACAPGMLWRFLAHGISGVSEVVNLDVEERWYRPPQFNDWQASGLALYRDVWPRDFNDDGWMVYRPLIGCRFAYRPLPGFKMRRALAAYAWFATNGRVPKTVIHPTRGSVVAFNGQSWPRYGSDEDFLQRLFYPAALPHGVFTVAGRNRSVLFERDMAAVKAANHRSELTYVCGALVGA